MDFFGGMPMSILVHDQSVIDQLKTVVVSADVRDAQGALLGYFQPAITPDSVDQYECPYSEEELRRRANEGGGRPLAEILSDLRGRP
jgi:hypothetical protein